MSPLRLGGAGRTRPSRGGRAERATVQPIALRPAPHPHLELLHRPTHRPQPVPAGRDAQGQRMFTPPEILYSVFTVLHITHHPLKHEGVPMSSIMKPIERPLALGEQVYSKLRTSIRDGLIASGQPLQEVQLAEQLGVSRTPVREALRRLSSEGLLVSDGRSFVVPELTLDDINDIYEIRMLVEPAAIRYVARLASLPEVRRPLDEALQAATRAHVQGDADAFRGATIRFRAAWLALVANPRLVHIIEQYADHMLRIRRLTLDNYEMRKIVLQGLGRIAAALAEGDGELASAAMREHIEKARVAFIDALGLHESQASAPARGNRTRPDAKP